MSYQTWTIEGIGVNVSKICQQIESARGNGRKNEVYLLHQLLNDAIAYNNTNNNVLERTYPDAYNLIRNADNDAQLFATLTGEDILEELRDYEGTTDVGPDSFIRDLMDMRWFNGRHVNINSSARDEFNDESLYWYLTKINPWEKPEFADRRDCEQTIRSCFEHYTRDIDIEDVYFQVGG